MKDKPETTLAPELLPTIITLANSSPRDIPYFVDLESSPEAARFVLTYESEKHAEEMARSNVHYLNIYCHGNLAGFAILTTDAQTAELRRIVIDSKNRGIGQVAIQAIENHCIATLDAHEIWLDVFEDNTRALHIYQKAGYQAFKSEHLGERTLIFLRKPLRPAITAQLQDIKIDRFIR